MRAPGVAVLGVFVVAVTAALHGRAQEPEAEAHTPVVSTEQLPPLAATSSLSVEPRETAEVRVSAQTRAQPQEAPRSSRRTWWRSRNRYPGPIPTPAEWQPPEGPIRIGLQVGHWRAAEAPRELRGIRDNGTSWQGMHEWRANFEIAQHAGRMLEELGYVVDILPAVVPPSYRAHLFISIHADGSNDSRASGFRVSPPRRDATGRASSAARVLERTYASATGLTRIPTSTRRMRNYYAFNFRRYEHALHPMTIALIIETGFLTSAGDRRVILDEPERAARGIVDAIVEFPVTATPRAAVGR